MRQAFVNCRILQDGALLEGHAVIADNGVIADIVPAARLASGAARHDLAGAILSPGLIDIQVNGGGGVLFNDATTIDAIAKIGAAHRKFGTTGFLPTLISEDLEIVAHAIAAADGAIEAGVPGVLGVHIEGPFISPERSGVHDASKLRALNGDAFELLTSLKRGCTMVTLAPEVTSPDMISRLSKAGIIVCAGHTDATYEQARSAIEHGVTAFTHLFNAMSPLTSRAPGVVGAALDDRDTWVGVIVDGRHIAPATLRIAFRAKPYSRIMLVTDAMPSVGMKKKQFMLQGKPIRVVDGVCVDANGTLAGADLDMASAVRNAVEMVGIDVADALRMASSTAAELLGLSAEVGRIAPGLHADLVHLDDSLHVRSTWIKGERAFA